MALFRTRITFDSDSGLSEDRVNLTMGWDSTEAPADLLSDLADQFETLATTPAAGTAISVRYATGYIPLFYEIFPALGGEALAVQDSPGIWTVSGTGSGPHETALVISYLVSTPRGNSPRGRNYYGPWASNQIQVPRPAVALMDDLVLLGSSLHAGMLALNAEQVVLNALGTVASSIVGFRVDNAWDTQRRRGLAPTASSETII